jgi:hypothetical protein
MSQEASGVRVLFGKELAAIYSVMAERVLSSEGLDGSAQAGIINQVLYVHICEANRLILGHQRWPK